MRQGLGGGSHLAGTHGDKLRVTNVFRSENRFLATLSGPDWAEPGVWPWGWPRRGRCGRFTGSGRPGNTRGEGELGPAGLKPWGEGGVRGHRAREGLHEAGEATRAAGHRGTGEG